MANAKQPADFLYDNLAIQTNAIHSAWRHGVKKLLFFATSAAYPRQAAQPLREEYLLTGPMEPSNEAYSIAKIAGVKLCQAYRKQHGFNAISAMPCNIYGPGDKFDAENANVLGALLRRFVEAKESGAPEVVVWGSGTPRREFLHVEDLASAALFLMRHYDGEVAINVGASEDVTIRELAETIARVTGYTGRVVFDSSKPDGVPRKLLDTGRLSALGWKPSIPLEEGIAETYRWFMTTRPKA
jgi:GDP-L-fucose synthase